jgi:hypothetical protein
MAAIAVVLSAGVAVLVNVWTNGWPWAAGAGLAALVVCQGGLEWLRNSRDHAPGPASGTGTWSVVQRVVHMVGGTATGARSPSPGGRVRVRQWFGKVNNADIVGVDGDPGREIPDGSAGPRAVDS